MNSKSAPNPSQDQEAIAPDSALADIEVAPEPQLPAPCRALPTPIPQPLSPGGKGDLSELATCIEETHPHLAGRVQIERYTGLTVWLPCLMGVRPRRGDRVIVSRVAGSPEPIVTGVVDGYRPRKEPQPRTQHLTRLRPDEVIVLEADDGTPLLELACRDGAPIVRFRTPNVHLAAEKAMILEADTIAMVARQGPVCVAANEDVVVQGEHIHLN